jgi:glutamate/tyrosine decarboxylase-like PLP-dependent enzyme
MALHQSFIVELQAHSCFKKAAMVAGIKHVRVIPAHADNDYALKVSVGAQLCCMLLAYVMNL